MLVLFVVSIAEIIEGILDLLSFEGGIIFIIVTLLTFYMTKSVYIALAIGFVTALVLVPLL